MEQQLILAIDQGTTGTTVLLLNSALQTLAKGYTEISSTYPQNGWMDQSPKEIWDATVASITKTFSATPHSPQEVAVIGITNQRETTLLWDRLTGEPKAPAIVWQCRRTQEFCERLKGQGTQQLYHNRTGLLLDPYFSGTKLHWLLNHYDLTAQAEAGRLCFGTVDTWLLYKLTGGSVHATDHTNASRTLLMDLDTLQYEEELLEPLGIPRAILPEILPSSARFGETKGVLGLPDGIPIHGILGDQQAALFGQTAFERGEAKCTYGTGAFMMLNTGSSRPRSEKGLLATVGWTTPGGVTYALEGSAFIAGAAVQWLRDGLKVISSAPEIERVAAQVPDSGGLFFVPALAGLGAPYWRPEARGTFWGITRDTTLAHMARAVLEGIALQNHSILRLMELESGLPLSRLRVDGGASANNLLMQFQADILQREIVRPANIETTARGAGAMAALGSGLVDHLEKLRGGDQGCCIFKPSMDKERVSYYTKMWDMIVEKA